MGLTGRGVPSTALASPVTVTCGGLTKRFGGADGVLAVDGLDLDVPAGSVFGLLGPNGAGKTTTLRLLAGLARPTGGTITIDDRPVTADDAARRGIGVLDQDPRYYGWMTGRELVELAGKLQGLSPSEARSRATDTLRRVGLADAAQRRVGAYSGGMRQRLGIAQALVAAPRLLILDEPVSSLDPAGRRDLLALIAELRTSATVIFSTHVLADVERICDRVGIMDQGRLVIEGPLDDLLARYALPLYRIEADPGQGVGMASARREASRDAMGRPHHRAGGRSPLGVCHGRGGGGGRRVAPRRRGRCPPGGFRTGPTDARGCLPPSRRRDRNQRDSGMTGTRVLIAKELLESWRTYRLPVVAGLFLFVGLTSPLLAKFLPEIIEAAAGDQLPTIPIPPPVAAAAVEQVWKNLAQFGAFAAIILSMGAVATERDRGTAAFILSKAVSRGAFLTAKVVAIGWVLALAVILAVVVAWIYTAILFEPMPVVGWAAMAALAWLGLAAWAALTFLGSTVTGSAAAAAGLGFLALLLLSIVGAIPSVGRFTPSGLAAPAIALATGATVEPAEIFTPVVATIVLIALALGAAAWSFRRQEL